VYVVSRLLLAVGLGAHQALSCAPKWGALIGLLTFAGACESQDGYRELQGIGNYRIVSHDVFADCGAEPQPIADSRCVQVIPHSTGLWLQNCDAEQEQLDLEVELTQRGRDFELTRIDVERCIDWCAGGVSTGCTSDCPGRRSCDVTALLYRATLDLDQRRLHLELTEHAEVRLPMDPYGSCTGELLRSSALEAACSKADKIDAIWEPYD
jgi:hypothetical protein